MGCRLLMEKDPTAEGNNDEKCKLEAAIGHTLPRCSDLSRSNLRATCKSLREVVDAATKHYALPRGSVLSPQNIVRARPQLTSLTLTPTHLQQRPDLKCLESCLTSLTIRSNLRGAAWQRSGQGAVLLLLSRLTPLRRLKHLSLSDCLVGDSWDNLAQLRRLTELDLGGLLEVDNKLLTVLPLLGRLQALALPGPEGYSPRYNQCSPQGFIMCLIRLKSLAAPLAAVRVRGLTSASSCSNLTAMAVAMKAVGVGAAARVAPSTSSNGGDGGGGGGGSSSGGIGSSAGAEARGLTRLELRGLSYSRHGLDALRHSRPSPLGDPRVLEVMVESLSGLQALVLEEVGGSGGHICKAVGGGGRRGRGASIDLRGAAVLPFAPPPDAAADPGSGRRCTCGAKQPYSGRRGAAADACDGGGDDNPVSSSYCAVLQQCLHYEVLSRLTALTSLTLSAHVHLEFRDGEERAPTEGSATAPICDGLLLRWLPPPPPRPPVSHPPGDHQLQGQGPGEEPRELRQALPPQAPAAPWSQLREVALREVWDLGQTGLDAVCRGLPLLASLDLTGSGRALAPGEALGSIALLTGLRRLRLGRVTRCAWCLPDPFGGRLLEVDECRRSISEPCASLSPSIAFQLAAADVFQADAGATTGARPGGPRTVGFIKDPLHAHIPREEGAGAAAAAVGKGAGALSSGLDRASRPSLERRAAAHLALAPPSLGSGGGGGGGGGGGEYGGGAMGAAALNRRVALFEAAQQAHQLPRQPGGVSGGGGGGGGGGMLVLGEVGEDGLWRPLPCAATDAAGWDVTASGPGLGPYQYPHHGQPQQHQQPQVIHLASEAEECYQDIDWDAFAEAQHSIVIDLDSDLLSSCPYDKPPPYSSCSRASIIALLDAAVESTAVEPASTAGSVGRAAQNQSAVAAAAVVADAERCDAAATFLGPNAAAANVPAAAAAGGQSPDIPTCTASAGLYADVAFPVRADLASGAATDGTGRDTGGIPSGPNAAQPAGAVTAAAAAAMTAAQRRPSLLGTHPRTAMGAMYDESLPRPRRRTIDGVARRLSAAMKAPSPCGSRPSGGDGPVAPSAPSPVGAAAGADATAAAASMQGSAAGRPRPSPMCVEALEIEPLAADPCDGARRLAIPGVSPSQRPGPQLSGQAGSHYPLPYGQSPKNGQQRAIHPHLSALLHANGLLGPGVGPGHVATHGSGCYGAEAGGGAGEVLTAVRGLTAALASLEELDLGSWPVSAALLQSLAAPYSKARLRRLGLPACRLDEVAVVALRGLPDLQYLDISSTRPEAFLLHSLAAMPGLEEVEVRGCRLYYDSGKALQQLAARKAVRGLNDAVGLGLVMGLQGEHVLL